MRLGARLGHLSLTSHEQGSWAVADQAVVGHVSLNSAAPAISPSPFGRERGPWHPAHCSRPDARQRALLPSTTCSTQQRCASSAIAVNRPCLSHRTFKDGPPEEWTYRTKHVTLTKRKIIKRRCTFRCTAPHQPSHWQPPAPAAPH